MKWRNYEITHLSIHEAHVLIAKQTSKLQTSKGFIQHKYTKAKQKHAYDIVMSGDSY